jgi:hypothetical protein
MPSGWFRFFWQDKDFYIAYGARNRVIAAVCFFLLIAIYALFQAPYGASGFLSHPASIFFLGLVEIFLIVLMTLVDTYVFDFKNRKVLHAFGFLGIVRKRSVKFSDIRQIDVQKVMKESFVDALQTESMRKLKKNYQLNFTTRSGVHYQVGVFDETAFRTLVRVAEDVRSGGK